jgi:hypothetical protein
MEEANMEDWLIKTFASTGTDGYNHATWDKYDAQLGLAIPWDLLGDTFVNTATAMADGKDFRIFIEKPTVFTELLLPELTLRNAHLVMRDGKLLFSRPTVIDAASATHTITTSHRAAASVEAAATDFPRYHRSKSTIVNVAKIEYDRDLQGNYHRVIEISNRQSQTDFGTPQPVTIKTRGVRLRRGTTDEDARQLTSDLAGDMLAFHSKPMVVVARSLSADKWFATPGDSVSLTDNWVRSTTDGTRGITAEPGWITRIVQNWQTGIGEVEIALHGEDQGRRTTYCPAGKIDTALGADNGYTNTAGGGPYIFLEANNCSLSSEADDITHFDVNDVIDIVAISPAVPGSPTKWQRTVSAKNEGAQRLTIDSDLSSPAWDNTLTYYVYSAIRSSAQATQATHAYIGDDADGNILDTARNNIYITQPFETEAFTAAVTTERVEWPPTDGQWANEGEACHPAMHRNAVYYANNLISRRTAPQSPWVFVSPSTTTSASYVCAVLPYKMYVGRGEFTSKIRKLNIGPIMQQTTSGTGKVRVTSSAQRPTSTTAVGAAMVMSFAGPKYQQEWSNTSTSYANVAATAMPLVPAGGREYTWITVEVNTTANTSTLYGFHEWWLGALE